MPQTDQPSTLDIIIPTYFPEPFLAHAVDSILQTTPQDVRVIVVNNSPHAIEWQNEPRVTVISSGGENLGWEGGLALGLKHSKSEFVGFSNDDIFIPKHSSGDWWMKWSDDFKDGGKMAAIGPASNLVMGPQNMWHPTPHVFDAGFLIGFFVVMRRAALDEVGGVDTTLPGGDDLDLSIRFKKAGYRLVVDKSTFVFHHGFVTGNKVRGDHTHPNGWNSPEMSKRTEQAIVAKHGRAAWEGLWSPVSSEAPVVPVSK